MRHGHFPAVFSAAKCPGFSTFLVGREGLEPPTPCASFISVQSDYQRFCVNPQVRWPHWFGLVMVVSGWFAVSCAPGAPLRAVASPSAWGCAEAPRYQMLISGMGGALLFGGGPTAEAVTPPV